MTQQMLDLLPYEFARVNRVLLRADEGDLARAVDRAWSVLLASNRTPWLFRAGGLPSWVVPDDEGRPVATTITEAKAAMARPPLT